MKGLQTLQLSNVTLNNTINVMSVGSPLSHNRMNEELTASGVNLVGSYNNHFDPVVHTNLWIGGTAALAIYGATMSAGVGLEAYLTGFASGGAAAAAGLALLKFQHPYAQYQNSNFNNLQTDIKNWSLENPMR